MEIFWNPMLQKKKHLQSLRDVGSGTFYDWHSETKSSQVKSSPLTGNPLEFWWVLSPKVSPKAHFRLNYMNFCAKFLAEPQKYPSLEA